MKKITRLSLCASIIFLVSCVENHMQLNFPFEETGNLPVINKKNICLARHKLMKFKASDPISEKSKGLIVLDGVITKAVFLAPQHQQIEVNIEEVLVFGINKNLPKKITVISPSERYGGISAVIGEKYRMLIFPIGTQYYSWAELGTAPKDPAYWGIYHCK